MDSVDLFNLVAKELNASGFLIVDSDDLDCVTFDSEVSAHKLNVISLVLDLNQATNKFIAVNALSNLKRQ